jgi:hypothetical protein
MDRSQEVEQLAVAWLAGMKAGDTVAVASLFIESAATTVIGNGADQWFSRQAGRHMATRTASCVRRCLRRGPARRLKRGYV